MTCALAATLIGATALAMNSKLSGGVIAFQQNDDIYLYDIARRAVINLTASFDQEAGYPAWSPDGGRLAFASGGDIYVIDLADRGLRRLLRVGYRAAQPGWSPDGGRLAYAALIEQGWQVFVTRSEETRGLPLVAALLSAPQVPAWSPDGSALAVNIRFDLYVVPVDGPAYALTGDHTAVLELLPAWSPDGREVLFAAQRDASGMKMYAMRLDDGSQRTLFDLPSGTSMLAWSPQRTSLALVSRVNGRRGIYLLDIASGRLRLLYENAVWPAWRPH